jgi:transcriptional regulator with XRE-family HTH domain
MGLSVRRVAETVGLDISGLIRIERGLSLPKRDTASRLYAFYQGTIPLGVIYDPTHASSADWLKANGVNAELKGTAEKLLRKHSGLANGDRRRARAAA